MKRIEILLTDEHREAEKKLKKILNLKDNDEKLALFKEVSEELLSHIAAEEEVYYSKIRDRIDENYEIEESKQEHHVAKVLINEINETSVDEPEWQAKLEVLKENLEHHHEEEEEDFFEKSKNEFSLQVAKDLSESFLAAKEQANNMTLPH